MLKLQNIRVQLSKPFFSPTSHKFLKLSVGTIIKKTSSPAKIVNDKSIEWSESLSLPLLYNCQIGFQIHDKHEFGYNPEEFQGMLLGTLSIMDISQKHSTWQIYTSGKEKIGFLSASIAAKNPPTLRREPSIQQKNESQISVSVVPEKKVFRIISIVARVPNSNMKKGFIRIKIGNEEIKTKNMKSRSGELVFIDAHQIPLQPSDTSAQVKVYTINANKEQTFVGEGTLELIGAKPAKKVVLLKEGFESGEVFIDSRIIDEEKANSIIANHSRLLNDSSLNIGDQSYLRPNRSIDSKSIDFAKRSQIIGNSGTDISRISVFSPRKKVSMVNHNNSIAFSKEERFKIYQDRPNQRVSYLKERSLEFHLAGSNNNYRGKSIGYGMKTDFTKGNRNVPGVGNYRLPSIWDRY